MTSTARLGLPLIVPSQAQKHVTVNESLLRLDCLTQLTVVSRSQTLPPSAPEEGDAYFVPSGGANSWSGQDGRIGAFISGGWTFVDPMEGLRAWIADEASFAVWTGVDWAPLGPTPSLSGARILERTVDHDHVLSPGSVSQTAAIIPENSLVFAVTGIVLETITGTATGFSLGVAGAPDRYGSGIGLSAGSWLRGITSAPQAYYANTPMELTAEGGSFAAGRVRIAVHLAEYGLPGAD